MIKTFEELIKERERSVKNRPSFPDELLLQSPGISEKQAAQLKQGLPKLSPIYVHLLQKYNLQKITLGGCCFDLGTNGDGIAIEFLLWFPI